MTAIGIDIVDLPRIQRMVHRYDDHILSRVFTEAEMTASRAHAKREQYLGTCFGVKEAIGKALGQGLAGIDWRDIEVASAFSDVPSVQLFNAAAAIALEMRLHRWHVSATKLHSVLVVVAVGSPNPEPEPAA
jgi:holo-[acyl-carrier protein] synthase